MSNVFWIMIVYSNENTSIFSRQEITTRHHLSNNIFHSFICIYQLSLYLYQIFRDSCSPTGRTQIATATVAPEFSFDASPRKHLADAIANIAVRQ